MKKTMSLLMALIVALSVTGCATARSGWAINEFKYDILDVTGTLTAPRSWTFSAEQTETHVNLTFHKKGMENADPISVIQVGNLLSAEITSLEDMVTQVISAEHTGIMGMPEKKSDYLYYIALSDEGGSYLGIYALKLDIKSACLIYAEFNNTDSLNMDEKEHRETVSEIVDSIVLTPPS